MSKVFLVDIDRCNGCRNCQIACKDEHCDQPWLPYAAAQPMTGQFWMNVKEKERGRVPVVKVSYTPTMCTHCADAPCKVAAPDAVYTRDDGLVIIDPEKAKGRRDLMDACPLGVIYYNEEADIPQKCTGCAHLLDDGWSEPRCVDACATEALLFVDEDDPRLEGAETLDATASFGPRVYYKNLPKRFVVGTLFDSVADEVVIGEKVELVRADGTVAATTTTDDFGDFRFDQVAPEAYTVRIGQAALDADARTLDVVFDDIDRLTLAAA